MASKICPVHNESFKRSYDKIESVEADVKKVKVTLYGDPEKGITGFLQANTQFVTEIKIYFRAIMFACGALTVAIIGALVNQWLHGAPK